MNPQVQSAILPDNCTAAIFIEANILDIKNSQDLKNGIKKILDDLNLLQRQYQNCDLGLTIAFGDKLWKSFGHHQEGTSLKPFTPLGQGLAPSTQCDILFHIQSMRPDVNFTLAMTILEHLNTCIQVQNETHGFRWIESRGLEGFVDGTENPKGVENILRIGTIANEYPDAGGSYVLVQKYRHDLKKWNRLSISEQEAAIGRTKVDNQEFSREQRLSDSHLGRVNLKENGISLKIVRRSLPYGTASGEHGLMFIAYCAELHNIEAQLLSMFGDTDGKTDRVLQHLSTAVSGAYYFAPSISRLKKL